MPARPSLLSARRGRGASYVGALAINLTSGAQGISFPPNTKIGDVAIIEVWQGLNDTASITDGDGGWAKTSLGWTSYGYWSAIFTKQLTAGDMAGVTVNSSGTSTGIVAVYRGPTTATVKTADPGDSGSVLSLAGFTKNIACRGIVTIAQDRDPGSTPTPPAGSTLRAGGNFGYFTGHVADILAPSGYINGASMEWTDMISGTAQVGWIIELT